MLTILLTSLFTIKCWLLPHRHTILPHGLLHNKVFKLKTAYQKLWTWCWTWSWKYNITHQIGGGNKSVTWTFSEIRQYATNYHDFEDGHKFKFMSNVYDDISVGENCVKTQIPIQKLSRLSRLNLIQICKVHKIQANQRTSMSEVLECIANHKPCDICLHGYVIFMAYKEKKTNTELVRTYCAKKKFVQNRNAYEFPPQPTPHDQMEKIVNSFCLSMQPDSILEEGCAVCGSLCIKRDMKKIAAAEFDRDLLCAKMSGVTRQMCHSVNDAIKDVEGPVIDNKCSSVCKKCLSSLKLNRVPPNALVNGNWLGDVPPPNFRT